MSDDSDIKKYWLDDERMNVFFQPFRERLANPQSWDSKMNFWLRFIPEFCANNNLLMFDIKVLREKFRRKDKLPSCLNTVLVEMNRRGIVTTPEKFITASKESWVSWGVQTFVSKPAGWIWAKTVGPWEQLPDDGLVVLIDLVKNRASSLIERVHKQASHPLFDYVLKLSELKALCHDLTGDSDDSFRLVLRYLESKRMVLVIKNHGREDLVKFAHQPTAVVLPLNDNEKRVLQLKDMEANLEKEITILTQKIESLLEEARVHLSKDSRTAAKTCLRKKKPLQTTLELREQNLENLRVLLNKIHSAHTEAKIVEVYELGVRALKKHAKEFNMTTERVGDAIDDVREALDEQQEIGDLLSNMSPNSDVTTVDLEQELADLLNEDEALDAQHKEELAAKRISSQLPRVPSHEPTTHVADDSRGLKKQPITAAASPL